MSKLAERMRALRKEKGLTQGDIAAYLGVSQNVVSKYEAGMNEPSIDNVMALAGFFGVSVDYLVGYGEAEEKP